MFTKNDNLIGRKCKVFKRDEKGAKTEEVIISGKYEGIVRELVIGTTSFGKQYVAYDVGMIRTVTDGVIEFKKVPLEVIEFNK